MTAESRPFASTARLSLAARLALLGLLLFCEKFALNFLVDFHATEHATGLGGWLRDVQHIGFRFVVAFALSLALFAYARADARWPACNEAARDAPVRLRWLLLHALLLLPLLPLSYYMYGNRGAPLPLAVMALLWAAFAAAAVMALIAGLAPAAIWKSAARVLGVLWLYALVAAAVAVSAMQWSEALWQPTAAVTFDAVARLLAPLIPTLTTNPSSLVLRSSHFAVEVSRACSGLEGAGLLVAFCSAWLLCFRREYYFPRALLLLPLALALSFALNVLRIATLMLIGDAGYPAMAIYGFHSQAGWIAFNCTAGVVAFASRRSRWFNRVAHEEQARIARARAVPGMPATSLPVSGAREAPAVLSAQRAENPTAAYLLPFLLILAAGMIARALSSGFETLYVLRPLAAGIALVVCWPRLRRLQWRFSWRGPLIGAAIFVLWVGIAHLLMSAATMPAALQAMPAPQRVAWLAIRIAAAVVTVPIAEELAFRGYLLRRIEAVDFEAVRFRDVGAAALIFSAVAFGLEHGALWLPGVIAGLAYAWVVMRTDHFGEAVAAHATTNALLAGYVLGMGQWQLW
ncbi:MAG TPA: exosortase E/protease, VPEID-CTERM system [Steroidobacteraceae bacterium]|nr:exosortase E/protease, VPEID-CTERM system [Steroidobacteraceae bacterium]